MQILEDLPDSVNLKTFLLSETSHGKSQSAAQSLGRALGSWLRSFHTWTDKPAQADLQKTVGGNQAMKEVKHYANYVLLIQRIETFPQILQDSRDVFEKVVELAVAELEQRETGPEYGVVNGDFWTGK